MSNQELSHSEQEQIRREKRAQLIDMGVNPYPPEFNQTHNSAEVISDENLISEEGDENKAIVSVAGRVMARCIMGKAAFFHIQDSQGSLQVYIRRDDVGVEAYNTVFKKLVDIGDIVGIKGFVFKTRTGETTVHAEQFELLTKNSPSSAHPKRSGKRAGRKSNL